MTKTNKQRAAEYRQLQAEYAAAGNDVMAERCGKRAAHFEAPAGDNRSMAKMPRKNLEAAIDAEAKAWAECFDVKDPMSIEARRNVMRANIAVGYFAPLAPFYREA